MKEAAALLFTLLGVLVIAFQLALVIGAPWGSLCLGGRWTGALPWPARVLPLLNTVVLMAAVAVVLAQAGLVGGTARGLADQGIALVLCYAVLGVIANAITPSRRERQLWLPVAVLMAVSALGVIWG